MARRLEDNHIIVNYQAAPDEEGFTASGALRMGVAEMTRFGMKEPDFQTLAELTHDVIVQNKPVKSQVTAFRKRFQEMQYCFSENELPRIQKLLEAIV
jgi:aminomethyltransferase